MLFETTRNPASFPGRTCCAASIIRLSFLNYAYVVHMNEHVQVMSALHMIMQKWKQENVFRDHPDMDPTHVQLRIVMLGKLCGAVIGENGKTINDIKMATHTDIRVQVSLLYPRRQLLSFWL